ncbi:MAG: hypothetical protein MUF64_25120 [Polyangiaceae bacterium]|jgi:hypothetical protein|nr:hypothetical protein [Polyangiaceae bacterium]
MSENKSHESVEQIEENEQTEEIEVNRVKSLKTNVKGGWSWPMGGSGGRTCFAAEEL